MSNIVVIPKKWSDSFSKYFKGNDKDPELLDALNEFKININSAFAKLTKLGEKGKDVAYLIIADLYSTGFSNSFQSIPENPKKTIFFLEKAFDMGNSLAAFSLGKQKQFSKKKFVFLNSHKKKNKSKETFFSEENGDTKTPKRGWKSGKKRVKWTMFLPCSIWEKYIAKESKPSPT